MLTLGRTSGGGGGGVKRALKEVAIYCDGSSLGTGRPRPCGGRRAARLSRVWRAVGLYLGTATNQQAEIAAAAIGLEHLREPCRVLLKTDSRYVVETMNGRFRRKSNHDWWARLDKALADHRIEWEWIKGHAGHAAQEAVDQAARRIAARPRGQSVLRAAAEAVEDYPRARGLSAAAGSAHSAVRIKN